MQILLSKELVRTSELRRKSAMKSTLYFLTTLLDPHPERYPIGARANDWWWPDSGNRSLTQPGPACR